MSCSPLGSRAPVGSPTAKHPPSLLKAYSFTVIIAEKLRQEQLKALGSQLVGTVLFALLFFLLVFNSSRTVNSAEVHTCSSGSTPVKHASCLQVVATLKGDISDGDFLYEAGAEFRKTFHQIGSVGDFWLWCLIYPRHLQ